MNWDQFGLVFFLNRTVMIETSHTRGSTECIKIKKMKENVPPF
jgi:hypothetical protein